MAVVAFHHQLHNNATSLLFFLIGLLSYSLFFFVDAHLEQSIAAGHTAGPSPLPPSLLCVVLVLALCQRNQASYD